MLPTTAFAPLSSESFIWGVCGAPNKVARKASFFVAPQKLAIRFRIEPSLSLLFSDSGELS